MNLDELNEEYGLSVDVVDFCFSNELHGIARIKAYYVPHGTYMPLPGCNEQIEIKLLNLLMKVQFRQEMSNDTISSSKDVLESSDGSAVQLNSTDKNHTPAPESLQNGFDPTLLELARVGELSVRAFNVCENNGLLSLSAIKQFHERHHDFRKLRNCGIKTELEIERLLLRSEESVSKDLTVPLDYGSMRSVHAYMTMVAEYEKLGQAAKEVLDEQLIALHLNEVVGFFMRNGKKLQHLTRVSSSAKRELQHMRNRLFDAMENQRSATQRDTDRGRGVLSVDLWFRTYNIPDRARPSMFDQNGSLTLFRFLTNYMAVIDKRNPHRVRVAFLTEHNVASTNEYIATSLGVTRERVRQVLKTVDDHILALLAPIAELPGVLERYPELIQNGSLLIINKELTDPINANESSKWSPRLFAYIAVILNGISAKYVSWGSLFDKNKATNKLDRTNLLILQCDNESLIRMLLQAFNTIHGQIHKTSISIDLNQRSSGLDQDKFRAALQAVSQIIKIRFPEVEIQDGVCMLPPNQMRFQVDILYEILTRLDKPSHASAILAEWNRTYPEKPVTEPIIRSVAIRENSLFFSIGRTSTYGLKTWLKDRPGLKGGTIRSIIHDMLKRSVDPIHYIDLTYQVKRFRPETNITSIRTNLQIDRSGKFVLLKNGFVGLAKRKYDRIPPAPRSVPGSLMRAKVLAKFIGHHTNDLANELATKCNATGSRIDHVIQDAIEEGRLLVDSSGNITGTRSLMNDADSWSSELPLSW